MNCPQCGSLPAKYLGTFQCGSLTDSGGFLHHTNFCKEFSEFRKPLDAKMKQLECELDEANEYARRLNWKIKDLCAERDDAIAGKLKKNNGLL